MEIRNSNLSLDVFQSDSLPAQKSQSLAQRLGEKKTPDKPNELEEAFQDFVGQTFFAEMIKSLRSTQQPSEYFHGGRAEEIFQGQFDQVLTEELSDASADKISKPMFELFNLPRPQ